MLDEHITLTTSPVGIAAYIAISASAILYTFIWTRPKAFSNIVKPLDPSMGMYYAAVVIKIAQFTTTFALFDYDMCIRWVKGEEGQNKQLLCGALALLMLFGQDLNRRVYKLLGIDGVYYGARFGKQLEWVTNYPFNSIRDPQYIGSICTVLGIAPFLPPDIAAFWVLQYLYLMWVESDVPVEEDDGRHAHSGKKPRTRRTKDVKTQ